jgi:hypothetical protein
LPADGLYLRDEPDFFALLFFDDVFFVDFLAAFFVAIIILPLT